MHRDSWLVGGNSQGVGHGWQPGAGPALLMPSLSCAECQGVRIPSKVLWRYICQTRKIKHILLKILFMNFKYLAIWHTSFHLNFHPPPHRCWEWAHVLPAPLLLAPLELGGERVGSLHSLAEFPLPSPLPIARHNPALSIPWSHSGSFCSDYVLPPWN